MIKLTTPRRRSARRRLSVKLLEIAIAIAFALVMINVVLPWAARSISDSYVQLIEQSS